TSKESKIEGQKPFSRIFTCLSIKPPPQPPSFKQKTIIKKHKTIISLLTSTILHPLPSHILSPEATFYV
ncbi:hypothetical protein, partial [Bacillus pumilus]|uniref:hypothetical protein n=1 Tax=Bacillus pumilus TaxID=1408 RepID=UPI001C931412